jgi:hypothetical protein
MVWHYTLATTLCKQNEDVHTTAAYLIVIWILARGEISDVSRFSSFSPGKCLDDMKGDMIISSQIYPDLFLTVIHLI